MSDFNTAFLQTLEPPKPEFEPQELETLGGFALVSGLRPEGPGGPPFSLEGREYLRELYQERRDRLVHRLVLRKAAQLGMTIHQLIRGAWFTADSRKRFNVGFMFPTKDAVEDLSATRFKPMFQGSGRMMRMVGAGGLARVSSVRFGVSLMRFRGLQTGVGVDSFPSDALFFDEVRLMSLEMIARAEARTKASTYVSPEGHTGVHQYASTAGFPGQDIDYYFQRSDQHYFMTRCPSPGCLNKHGFCMYESFEAWLSCVDFKAKVYRCPLCKSKIEDTLEGFWEAMNPGVGITGYAYSGTMLGNVQLPALISAYESKVLDGINPGDFYNSDLGIPHQDPDAVIVTNQVFDEGQKVDPAWRWPLEPAGSSPYRCFGIDQRDNEKHILIGEWGPNGRVYPAHAYVLEASGEEAIQQTVRLLRDWGCTLGVIDEGPSYDYAKGVAARLPRGVAWLARYVEDAMQPLEWADQSEKDSLKRSSGEAKWEYWVRIDRFKHLSQAFTLFRSHRVAVPADLPALVQELRRNGERRVVSVGLEWREHMANIARVKVPKREKHPDTGEVIDKGEYKQTFRHLAVEPHFAHAWGYLVAALMRRRGGTEVLRASGPAPEPYDGTYVGQLPQQLQPKALSASRDKRCGGCAWFTPPVGDSVMGKCNNERLALELGARVPMNTPPQAENCRHWRAK